jgi:plasmid replication initiation protein
MLELRVSNWLYKGLMSGKGVLTLDREWFLLTGGLERVVYRIARKHAGDQPQGWMCRLSVLHAKTGSEAPLRNFAVAMRKIAARNDMPRYVMTMTESKDGEAAVQFRLRSLVLAQGGQQPNEREAARAAWIDSGRDPRTFEAALSEWVASGAPIAQFITQYAEPASKFAR